MDTWCFRAISALFLLYTCGIAQENYDGWRILGETAEGAVRMAFTDTEAVITQDAFLEVGGNGVVSSLSFNNSRGHALKGTQGEMRYYWHHRGGLNAWWRHMHKNNNVEIHRPSTEQPVPVDWFGRTVACVTKKNRHYVGRLMATQGSGNWFSLDIEGGTEPIKFYAPAVRELHALK